MQILIAFIVGLVFGIGLIIGGMTNQAKVQNFLDLTGAWDPSLGFVMGGAVVIGLIGFGILGRHERTLLGGAIRLPTASAIDRRLVVGGLTFGVGWGLGGFCPGPALASVATGDIKPLIFTGAMMAGMFAFEIFERSATTRK